MALGRVNRRFHAGDGDHIAFTWRPP